MSFSPDLQDWANKTECFPFEDNDNYYITVESEYETPGNEKEKRLSEAVLDGAYKLLKFYGKDTLDPYGLSRESSAKEHFVSPRPCVRMKVLVAVPKSVFDSIGDDLTACTLNKPEEGYLSAFIPVGEVGQKIDSIVSQLESFKIELLRSDKFISNINIYSEIKRLKTAGLAIQRYIKLNNIAPVTLEDPECFDPKQVSRDLELGFTYDYKAAFALVEADQYTIGYDCFLETSVLNHITTINYLTRLDLMLADLEGKFEASFNVFDFLSKHTLPIPIIETKQEPLDGAGKYDEDGNLSIFANLAKLITLDLDINLCKTDEEKAKEEQTLKNAETKRLIAEAAKDTSEFVGNNKIGTKGVADLRAKLEFISPANRAKPRVLREAKYGASSGGWKIVSGASAKEEINYIGYQESVGAPPGVVIGERVDGAFIPVVLEERLSQFYAWAQAPTENGIDILYNDVMAKVNLGCVLEETIQCLLKNMITSFGEATFNDPDLEKVFRLQDVSLGGFNKNCELDRCDGTPDIGLKIGFPVFQGLNIPSNFPTLDFLAGTIDQAIKGLYNALVSALSSLILGILQGLCELLFSSPDVSGFLAGIGEGFKSWLSKSLGIDIEKLSDPEAWASVLTSAGGTGFLGVIGRVAGNIEGSLTDAYTETGIAINWPNPETGQVEEKFISPEFLVSMMSDVSSATETVETILSETETQSVYMGIASPETITLCYNCLSRNGNSLFQSEQDVEDVFSAIGKLVKPQFLLGSAEEQFPVASNVCDIGDGSGPAILRAAYLQNKDPDLPPEEIEEIINKEKAKKKTKILKALETLENFQAGNLVPAFPSMFGADGLIPEIPPVISEINQLVAREGLQGIISNFSLEVSAYLDIWDILFVENSPNDIFSDININAGFGRYQLGYTPASLGTMTIPEYNRDILGPYPFGSDIDITGIAKEGTTLNYYGGEADDDTLFERLVRDLEPLVESSTHTFGNKMFFPNFAYSKTPGLGSKPSETVGQLNTGAAGISGARAYAYLLMKEMDTYQEGGDVDIPSINPYWDEAFNGQDNQLFELTVSYDGNNVTVDVKTYLGNAPAEIVRDSGWNNRIVEVEVDDGSGTNSLSLKQNSEDYYVSSNAFDFLGRQVSTGRLNTQEYKYFNLSNGQVTRSKNGKSSVTDSRSNAQVINDIYNATGGRFTDVASSGTTTAHDMIKDILVDFADYIAAGKYSSFYGPKYSTELKITTLKDISLLYPSNDILDFSGLISFNQVFASQILSDTLSGNYCDTLGPTRRANSISSIKILIRLFIVERAMIAIQATNGFDIDFMQSDLFISSIYKRLKTEVQKYKSAFDTIPGNLFPDMRDAATKYYEILKLDDENIEVPETGKDAFTQMIVEEIQSLRQPLINNLKLKWDSSTWDGFLIKVIFGEIDELDELESYDSAKIINFNTGGRSFVFKRGKEKQGDDVIYKYDLLFVKYEKDGTDSSGFPIITIKDYTIASAQCEQSEELVPELDDEPLPEATIKEYGPYNFGKKVSLGMLGEGPDVRLSKTISEKTGLSLDNDILPALDWLKEKSESDAKKSNADKKVAGTRYTSDHATFGDIEWDLIADITYPFLVPDVREERGKEYDQRYDQEILFTLIKKDNSAIREAEAAAETAEEKRQAQITEKENEIYSNLRDMLIETKEYQILFNNLVPIKNMIASLSLYQFCALSDTAVYPEVSEAGINLADMLIKTKISILQIFCASVYGNKKIAYTDPFLEKAGTDLIS